MLKLKYWFSLPYLLLLIERLCFIPALYHWLKSYLNWLYIKGQGRNWGEGSRVDKGQIEIQVLFYIKCMSCLKSIYVHTEERTELWERTIDWQKIWQYHNMISKWWSEKIRILEKTRVALKYILWIKYLNCNICFKFVYVKFQSSIFLCVATVQCNEKILTVEQLFIFIIISIIYLPIIPFNVETMGLVSVKLVLDFREYNLLHLNF